MDYYLHQNGEQVGPYSQDQITAMLSSGQISNEDLIWHDGLPEWKPVGQVISAGATAAPQIPSLTPSLNPAIAVAQTSAGAPNSIFPKIRLASLLGALFLFFVPWVDIQCSGTSLATQTGMQVITGGSSPSEQMENMAKEAEASGDETMEMKANPDESIDKGYLVGLAFFLIVAAIILSCISLSGDGGAADKFAGILPTCALGLLLIQLFMGFPAKREMMKDMRDAQKEAAESSADDPVEAAVEDAMGAAMAERMAAMFKVETKPAFYFELVALGIPTLLMLLSIGSGRRQ